MNCPDCGGMTKVIESRRNEDGMRRRRECLSCQLRLTTMETVVWEDAPDEPPGLYGTSFKSLIEKDQKDQLTLPALKRRGFFLQSCGQ